MSITVVFDPPLPSDSPATFNQKAFTLLGDLNDWSSQANDVAADINADKTALLNAGLATVAANVSNVSAVGSSIAAVNTVANDLNEPVSAIETVAGSIANVDAVGGSISNVNTVAGSISNVNTVAGNLAGTNTVGTVAGSIANVNTVGNNIASVNTAAANMTAIKNAATNAANAASSASAAATSASNAQNSAQSAANSATSASASALSAVNAPGTSGTSTSSLTVGLGNQAFTTQTGKAWVVGQPVIIARTSAPATTWMYGVITSYNSGNGAMVVSVSHTLGSGTATDWTISLTGPMAGVDITDIGTNPNQIPLNQHLGSMAYVSKRAVTILGGTIQLETNASRLGFATGAGGAVTQVTSKSTGVTLNAPCGQITMSNAALAAGTAVSFTLTNSAINATDVVLVSIASGATAGAYSVTVDQVSSGSCRVSLRNLSAGSLSEAVVLNFVVIQAVNA